MTKPMHEAHPIAFEGAVDADGHVLEPPDLWETYIDPQHRDRALRIRTDEQGLEELEIGGERSTMSRRGFPSTLGAMGAPDLAAMQKDPARTYLAESPYGSMDAGPGAVAGVHEGLQPLDLRVLRRLAPPRAHRPPVAVRPGRRGRRAGTGHR